MFSDYHLHMNAKNPDIKIEQQSVVHLSASIADDFNYKVHNSPAGKPSVSRYDSNSHIELNFGNLKEEQPSKSKLSDKIKYKIRESRDKAAGN